MLLTYSGSKDNSDLAIDITLNLLHYPTFSILKIVLAFDSGVQILTQVTRWILRQAHTGCGRVWQGVAGCEVRHS